MMMRRFFAKYLLHLECSIDGFDLILHCLVLELRQFSYSIRVFTYVPLPFWYWFEPFELLSEFSCFWIFTLDPSLPSLSFVYRALKYPFNLGWIYPKIFNKPFDSLVNKIEVSYFIIFIIVDKILEFLFCDSNKRPVFYNPWLSMTNKRPKIRPFY